MSTNENGFLGTSGELTLPHQELYAANKQGGITVLITRITFPSEMPSSDKAQSLYDHLTAAGLDACLTLIRVFNLSDTDRGPTDHEAVAVIKPTVKSASQIAVMCADPTLGPEAMFELGCGVIDPPRDGKVPRAVATRLPLGGAPVVTTKVIAGIVLQSKEALTQRLPVMQQGIRQMVLEATQLAIQEQVADAAKHKQLIDAGPEASSAEAVAHSERGLAFTNEVIVCLECIATDPDSHYSLFFGSLNWKSGRAFCLTSDIGIPHGQSRNKIVGQLLRDAFTATVVRVFSSASSTGSVYPEESMALARNNVDRLMRTGVIPPSMVGHLQCTLAGQPVRLMQPDAAAHAAVTPTTLRARWHTMSMWKGHFSDYACDQMDRHQMQTANEVVGKITHAWDETTVKKMIAGMMGVAKYERICINVSIGSDTTLILTPGPNTLDNDKFEKACRAHVRHLRESGATGLTCDFVNSTPYRPCPIPQMIQNLMQYERAVYDGTKRWSRCALRAADNTPEIEGGGAGFGTALAGTGRFSPPSEDTALAIRSSNAELIKINANLRQQVAQLGAEQLTLRTDAQTQMNAWMELQKEENRTNMEQMKALHSASVASTTAVKAQLDALIQAVTELPEGA